MAARESIDKPKYLVLGPGGARGFYFLGLLHQLYIEGFLADVKGYAGSSVGAMIGLLMTCGYTPVQIMTIAADTTIFTDFYNVSIGEKLSDMQANFGITSNAAIRTKLEQAILDRYGRLVSLGDLYLMTGVDFYSVSYNVDARKTVYMSHRTHPELDVVTAVLLSINIPLLFYQMSYEGEVHIDGGFSDPLPIYPFDDGYSQVLAIYINTCIRSGTEPGRFLPKLTTYLHQILTTSIHQVRDMIVATASPRCQFIQVDSSVVDTTGVSFSVADKAKMIMHGVKIGQAFLNRDRRTALPPGLTVSRQWLERMVAQAPERVFKID